MHDLACMYNIIIGPSSVYSASRYSASQNQSFYIIVSKIIDEECVPAHLLAAWPCLILNNFADFFNDSNKNKITLL